MLNSKARSRSLTPVQIVLGHRPARKVAKAIGVDHAHLYRVIWGENEPSFKLAMALCKVLAISPEELQKRRKAAAARHLELRGEDTRRGR